MRRRVMQLGAAAAALELLLKLYIPLPPCFLAPRLRRLKRWRLLLLRPAAPLSPKRQAAAARSDPRSVACQLAQRGGPAGAAPPGDTFDPLG